MMRGELTAAAAVCLFFPGFLWHDSVVFYLLLARGLLKKQNKPPSFGSFVRLVVWLWSGDVPCCHASSRGRCFFRVVGVCGVFSWLNAPSGAYIISSIFVQISQV